MRLGDLLPLGKNAPGCVNLQHRDDTTVRVVWWTDEAPADVRAGHSPPRPVYISNITEEVLPEGDVPEAFLWAFACILDEIVSDPAKAVNWTPGTFQKAAKRAWTALSLKKARTQEDFDKALRVKERLGPWL